MMEKARTIWSKETGIERNPVDEVEVSRPMMRPMLNLVVRLQSRGEYLAGEVVIGRPHKLKQADSYFVIGEIRAEHVLLTTSQHH
jgi:hypothetical protein